MILSKAVSLDFNPLKTFIKNSDETELFFPSCLSTSLPSFYLEEGTKGQKCNQASLHNISVRS